jgi:hypothetical protein
MNLIYHSGYGYSRPLCEDVASWFLNKFFPRHKITVDILHRGLKREGVHGWCDIIGKKYYPRNFLIELDTYMDKELYIKTLFHELVHVKQWVDGTLSNKKQYRYYNSVNIDEMDYEDQPHEIEAYKKEEELFNEYKNLKF